MANNLYITAIEAESGKITLVLGVMEMLTRHIRTVGFFRPVILSSDPPDNDIQLILSRYNPTLSYADTYGCTLDQAHLLGSHTFWGQVLNIELFRSRNTGEKGSDPFSPPSTITPNHAPA